MTYLGIVRHRDFAAVGVPQELFLARLELAEEAWAGRASEERDD